MEGIMGLILNSILIATIIMGVVTVFSLLFGPRISEKFMLRSKYLVPFREWCSILYKEITEFKKRYADKKVLDKFSKTLIIIDYRELHNVFSEAGKYLGKIEKEKPEIYKYLSKLERSVDNLWHSLQDDFSVNFDQSEHDEWMKAIIEYTNKKEFVKAITGKRKRLNQELLNHFKKEEEFKKVKKYLLKQIPKELAR